MNEAYGQTDVMRDPNYLRTLLTHTNPHVREQAQLALRQLEIDQGREQQLGEFRQRQGAIESERANREADRRESVEQREATAHESEAGRTERGNQLAVYREQSEKDRVSQGLAHAAEMSTDPAERKMLMNEYYKRIGFTPPATPVDAKTAALQKFAGVRTPGQPVETAPTAQPGSLNPSALTVPPQVDPTSLPPGFIGPPGSSAAKIANQVGLTSNFVGTDPNTKANYFQSPTGPRVGGAGDPSVGSLTGSTTSRLSNGLTRINLSDGGQAFIREKHPGAMQAHIDLDNEKYGTPVSKPQFGANLQGGNFNPAPKEDMTPTLAAPTFSPGSLVGPQPNPTPGPNAPPTGIVGPLNFPSPQWSQPIQPGATPPAQPRPILTDEEKRRQLATATQ